MKRFISDFEKQLKECLEGFENEPKFIGFASLREEGKLIRYSVEICKKKNNCSLFSFRAYEGIV